MRLKTLRTLQQRILRAHLNNISDIFPPFSGTTWFIIWPLIKFSGRSVAEYLDNANANERCPAPPWQRLPTHSFPITVKVSFFWWLLTWRWFLLQSTVRHDALSKSCSYIFPPPYPPFSPQMLPHLCPSYQSEHQWLLRPRPTHRNLLTSPCQRAPLRLNNQTISRLPRW